MADTESTGIRGIVPEWAKSCYRTLRVWALSCTLRPASDLNLPPEELEASAAMSVIVAVHDSPEVTERCLRSLEKFAGRAEVIVVDDGSKLDRTKKVLQDYCRRNNWKLIRNDLAKGHSRASEAGVAASSRPYVCLLNSDTIMTSRSWAGIAKTFEESPKIAVVGPSTSYCATPQFVSRAWHCRHYWTDGQIWSFAEKYAVRHQNLPAVDLPILSGFAFFVRRSVWDQTGGFDKNLPDYGNEVEFCRRLLRSGFRLAWSKASYIHHLGSESYGKTFGLRTIRQRSLEAESYIQMKLGN
jgi:GT2 family glycosyltransferase